jgi:WD40 repeat protein
MVVEPDAVKATLMYCSGCGTSIRGSGQRYCSACGAAVNQPPALPGQNAPRHIGMRWVILLSAGFCMLGAGIFWLGRSFLVDKVSTVTEPAEILVNRPAATLSNETTAGAFSPDGRFLVTGDKRGIHVWDARTWRKLRYESTRFAVRAVVFSQYGSTVAIVGDSETRIYESATAKLSRQIPLGGSSAAFSSNNQNLEIFNGHNLFEMDVATGRRLRELQTEYSSYDRAAFSADGSRVAVRAGLRSIVIFSAATGREVGSFQTALSSHDVRLLAFPPVGSRIAVVSTDGYARAFDSSDGRELQAVRYGGQPLAVAFSLDGNRLAVGCSEPNDGTVRVVEVSSGRVVCLFHDDFRTLYGYGAAAWLQFSPDGTKLATPSGVWDIQKPRKSPIGGHSDSILKLEFSADGSKIFSASADATARIWDARDGHEIQRVNVAGDCPSASAGPCRVEAAAFSPDHSKVALINSETDVPILNLPRGNVLRRLPIGRKVGFLGWNDPISYTAFSPDGSRIAWGTEYGGYHSHDIYLWDADSGRKIAELDGGRVGLVRLRFSPDAAKLVAVKRVDTNHTVLTAWEVGTGKVLYNIDNGAAFSFWPDGSKILVQLGELPTESRLQVVETATGRVLSVLQTGHEFQEFSLSPDGSKVVTAGKDASARIWDTTNGKLLRQLHGHVGAINTVAFSHSGSTVLTGGEDHTVRLWNAEYGRQIQILEGFPEAVDDAVFSPDDSSLAASTSHNRIWLWDLGTGKGVEAQ